MRPVHYHAKLQSAVADANAFGVSCLGVGLADVLQGVPVHLSSAVLLAVHLLVLTKHIHSRHRYEVARTGMPRAEACHHVGLVAKVHGICHGTEEHHVLHH